MVLASHVIFGAYGFWLPNDPRGSWSEFVGAWELCLFGRATKHDTTQSQAHEPHDHRKRMAAKAALRRAPVVFNGLQARAIGRGFGTQASRSKLSIWACSILPEHVHLVVARHHYGSEQIATLLKGAATRQLLSEGLHPFADKDAIKRSPSPWARGEWKVFLNTAGDVEHAISYVAENPLKEGKPAQNWPFVSPFDWEVPSWAVSR